MLQKNSYLGMYRLLNRVGDGRHCQVWEAMHDGRNERYALKIINEQYRNDSEQLNLMKHEFAVGRELSHPNVITIFEFDSSKQVPFIAMEFFAAATNLKTVDRAGNRQRRPADSQDHRASGGGPCVFSSAGMDPSRYQAEQLSRQSGGGREAHRLCDRRTSARIAQSAVWQVADPGNPQLHVAQSKSAVSRSTNGPICIALVA